MGSGDENDKMADEPVVFVLSGKRKSGKDFIAEKLKDLIGKDHCVILRLSGPLKYEYAIEHGLDFNRLLDSTDYKERYRVDMIRWGEEKRKKEPDYFCKKATEMATKQFNDDISDSSKEIKGNKMKCCRRKVWIVSDARRPSDLKYFKDSFQSTVAIRVFATDKVRKSRGWIFKEGVDDAESECGLDDACFDLVIENNGSEEELVKILITKVLKPALGEKP